LCICQERRKILLNVWRLHSPLSSRCHWHLVSASLKDLLSALILTILLLNTIELAPHSLLSLTKLAFALIAIDVWVDLVVLVQAAHNWKGNVVLAQHLRLRGPPIYKQGFCLQALVIDGMHLFRNPFFQGLAHLSAVLRSCANSL